MSRSIPQGIEVLVSKASLDPEFKTRLVERRAEAAAEIGLELNAAERAMLAAVYAEQLDAIIARTTVPHEHRRAFLGQAAAAMLAAVAAMAPVEAAMAVPPPTGSAPDKPPEKKPQKKEPTIEDRVFDLAARRFKLDRKKVTRETSLDKHLKNDWTGYLRFMEDLEREFKLKISLKTFRTFHTLGHAADYVKKATKKDKQPEKKPDSPGPVRGIRPDAPAS